MSVEVVFTGILIFCARVTDVSIGTIRTISIVQGRTRTAFLLGFAEVSLWLVVIATVLNSITSTPVLGLFYALGFSSGNVVGILLERRIAFGTVALRIITSGEREEIATRLRERGFAATTFPGQGMRGPVTMLYVVCRRRELLQIVDIVRSIEPTAFYTTETVSGISRISGSVERTMPALSAGLPLGRLRRLFLPLAHSDS